MSIRDRFRGALQGWRNPAAYGVGEVPVSSSIELPDNPRERYAVLEMVKSNRAYRDLRRLMPDLALPEDYDRIRALENPALQAVRFHVIHIFPGSLSDALLFEGTGALQEAASAVLLASNMGAVKDASVDEQATLGECWWKAVSKEDGSGVYLETRHPGEVVAFKEDNLRNAKYVRLDVELEEKTEAGDTWWTEVWDHDENRYIAWYHKQGYGAKLDLLGTTFDDRPITAFGHDFVPFVRAPFDNKTRPGKRGVGVFEEHLEPIDDLNRNATHARDIWHENADGVWATMPGVAGQDFIDMKDDDEKETTEEVRYGRRIIHFSGVGRMDDLVPDIDYKAMLDFDENGRKKLERSMAELRYFRGREGGDPSAAAIRLDVGPAIATAVSAKGSAEDALIKGVKMCLSMGRDRRLFSRQIPDYRQDRYKDLAFEPRAVFPESPMEKAAREEAEANALTAAREVSPEYLKEVLLEKGYKPEVAERMAGAAQRGRSPIEALLNSGRGAADDV